ncbi:MAG: ACP S-malonyltransferase [Candidatus Omnitrophota bacterium]
MKNIALIFPGQGAQKVGMGKEFFESSAAAKEIFQKADDILKVNLSDVIFNGPAEKLTSTAFCQPAIFTFSVAALKAFEAHPKFKDISPTFCAGLSLGEYSALVSCNALSFEEGLKLVERRSFFMDEATRKEKGAMAAVIGFPKDLLSEICKETGAQVANFNSPEQIVITGEAQKVAAACEKIRAQGAKTVIPLDVAGAFHSSLMQSAVGPFEQELAKAKFLTPKFPILSNVDAVATTDARLIRENLAKQITSSVRWDDSVRFMAQQGITEFIEIGPGKVLKGLMRKINPALKVYNIETLADLEALPF